MLIDKTQADRELRLIAEGREKLLESLMQAEKAGNTAGLPYQNYLIRQEIDLLVADIKADNKRGGGARAFKKFALYLGSIDPHIVALRAIQAVLSTLVKSGGFDQPQPVGREVAKAAGRGVYTEYLMRNFKKISPPLFASLLREYKRSMTRDEAHLIKAFKAKFSNEGYEFPTWGLGDIEHVGMYLIHRMAAHGFIEFWSRTERKNNKPHVVQYIALSNDLRSASLEMILALADNPSVSSPLIEPPRDWLAESNTGGGYHTNEMQRQLPYAVLKNGTKPVAPLVVTNLNYLQSIPWQVNGELLDKVRSASLKYDFGKVVGLDPGPKPPISDEPSAEELAVWKKDMRAWWTSKKVRSVLHAKAQRVFREAQDLRHYPAIWFAWYADSRGRKYARASGVSPQGTDLEKGLLSFHRGEPLTEEGIPWFIINGANKYGIDKVSFDDRIKWVEENQGRIIAAASGELDQFWIEADNPVSFLGWAIEYKEFVNSGRSPEFISRIPLGQDGTCNGLQHYSGLLADEVGGRAVNLTCGLAPNDIYLDVARATAEELLAAPAHAFRTAWLEHGINRSVAKTTTMTLPYGCTRFGCSEFIAEYAAEKQVKEIAMADYGLASNYLSHIMWRAVPAAVPKAMQGMAWLTAWADNAVKTGQPVGWTAPNGLWVRSEYEHIKKRTVSSAAFKTRLRMVEPTGKTDAKKTAQAVAPNFIHSMDASHLDFVVEQCRIHGIDIAAIHDDYGTHARFTPLLHRIIREEFVKLYKDNTILERLGQRTGFNIQPPDKGSLNLDDVLASPYFFG